ncbi:ClC family H(+)/Cl(-) exchange transporter [uncultured Dialister sp.]|uniref:ClC family H(+)/Cl(-) exchange transporter n=1 Tax=uncultured Dialister sp. TaxID=278064 RepID=UPI0025958CC1|nr:ClC family H(+)/Cl(-) exchange transporter [uncultured Dialister sp.]
MKEDSSSQSMSRQLFETYVALDNWHTFRLRLFIEGIFVGIFGGLCISLFRFLLGEAEALRIYAYNAFLIPAVAKENFIPLCLWAAALVVTGFLLYRMCLYAPMAGGSGIPQVKGVILGLYKMKWFRILWVKIIAGALGIGAGLSLGREGPSIQIGAVAGQGISRFLGRTRMEERYLITSGASAGLAAAFNAPLAGMMFALEELHRNFSGAVLLPTMTSAITATIVTRFFFGNSTSFHFLNLVPMPAEHLGLVVLIAISAGFAGILFNYGLLHTGAFYNLPVFKNQYVKILFALFSACLLGFFLPQVLGGGNGLVDQLAAGRYTSLSFLVLLLIGKYVFTLISYGCGVPGGFFLPLLVVGALLGSVEAHVLVSLELINEVYTPNIIIIGMVSLFAASVRSPITGTLLILEMTGDFGHLMALALGSAVAYITAELLKGEPIYDALLKKSLSAKPDRACEEERNIVEVPIGSGSLLEGKKIRDVPRMKQTIIIDLKRHGESVIPDPDIRLQAEDFLYILTASKNAAALKRLGEEPAPVKRGRKS